MPFRDQALHTGPTIARKFRFVVRRWKSVSDVRLRVEEHVCPGFDGRSHPERVVGDLTIWLYLVPSLINQPVLMHGPIYWGFIRGHAGSVLWYGPQLTWLLCAATATVALVVLLAVRRAAPGCPAPS